MRNMLISLLLSLSLFGLSTSLSAHVASADRATVVVKDAYKAVFNVITYDDKGAVLHSGYGCFISEDGIGVAAFSLFENAAKADVIDYKGKKMEVLRIMGANSTYDLVKFRVATGKKCESFQFSSSVPSEGTLVNLVAYTTNKKDQPQGIMVDKADDFKGYKYFQLSAANVEKNWGCPLTDTEGNLVAIVQKNVGKNAENACAIDARFVQSLSISALGAVSSDLRAIKIPKALPEKEQEALTYIFMLGEGDTITAKYAHEDFVAQYPDNAEGYVNRAVFNARLSRYEQAEQDFETAIEKSGNEASTMKEDGVRYAYSRQIYTTVLTGHTYDSWNLEKAREEAAAAYRIVPNPLYLMQEGHCLFAEKKYEDAYASYRSAATARNDSAQAVRGANFTVEGYYAAARSLELAKGDSLQVLALLDSVIVNLQKPYAREDARYFLERAQRRMRAGQYRPAVFDYNEYEKIIGPKNLSDSFYYLREQAEIQSRMYQQALDDIRTATNLRPENIYYRIEEALILLQAGLYEESVAVAKKVLDELPENPDCYKIMGVACGELKQKDKAVEYLTKAVSLGDEAARPLIEKYR